MPNTVLVTLGSHSELHVRITLGVSKINTLLTRGLRVIKADQGMGPGMRVTFKLSKCIGLHSVAHSMQNKNTKTLTAIYPG